MKLIYNSLRPVMEQQDGNNFVADVDGSLVLAFPRTDIQEWGGNPDCPTDLRKYIEECDLRTFLPMGVSKVTSWVINSQRVREDDTVLVSLLVKSFESEYSEPQDPGDFPMMDEWEEGE